MLHHNPQANIYCPFCGVILQFNPPFPSPDLVDNGPSWFSEVRAVFVNGDPSSTVNLSGIGLLSSRNVLTAPADSESAYWCSSLDVAITLFRRSENCWGYGFHESCWRLLHARLGDVNIPDIITPLFRLFWSTKCPCYSSFSFGHDYGGAGETHKPFGIPREVDALSPLHADPWDVPSLEELESYSLEVAPPPQRSLEIMHDYTSKSHSGDTLLEKLPTELLDIILAYLPLTDVASLGMLSRRLSRLVCLGEMSQSFWKSRFMVPHEYDFLFPMFNSAKDWFHAFFGVRKCLKNGAKSIVNRKRIRDLLEPICALLEQKTVVPQEPAGVCAVPGTKEEYTHTDNESQAPPGPHVTIGRSFGGQLMSSCYEDQLRDGCRALEYRISQFPLKDPVSTFPYGQKEIRISTVKVGDEQYVSGIRMLGSTSSTTLPSELGYIMPREDIVLLPNGEDVQAIKVVFSETGLRAIRFEYGNGRCSPWVGQNSGAGLAEGIFELEGSDKCEIVAGLDFYKVVLFGIASHGGPVRPGLEPIKSRLWSPYLPKTPELKVSSLEPFKSPRPFEPIINMDFGGEGGTLLGTLRRVIVRMISEFRPIVGFGFVFEDQILSFGESGETELSVVIDGPGGERITNACVVADDYYFTLNIRGFKIATNYGRNIIFSAIPHSYDVPKQDIPLRLPDSHIITGFIGTKMRNPQLDRNQIEKIGLQGQPRKDNTAQNWKCIQDLTEDLRETQLEYEKKFAMTIRTGDLGEFCTYAPLDRVQKITAATGLEGRSRAPHHISGLRFDYHDEWHCPSIVGQWMNESDSFQLDSQESVVGLTVWLRKGTRSREVRGVTRGSVVAVRVDTSKNRHRLFQAGTADLALSDYMQHQYQSSVEGELRAVSWILNSSYDRVRAVMRPLVSEAAPLMLVPEQEPPFDRVQKVFLNITGSNGCKDRLVRIRAHFYHDAILGLAFEYQSDNMNYIGYTDGPAGTQQSIELAGGERIMLFEVTTKSSEVISIEFQTSHEIECDKETRSPPRTTKRLCSSMNDDYDWKSVWCANEEMAAETPVEKALDCQYTFPDGADFAGIYVSCQQFSRMGAMFMPSDS